MAPPVVVQHSIPTNFLISMLQMSISTFDDCGMFEKCLWIMSMAKYPTCSRPMICLPEILICFFVWQETSMCEFMWMDWIVRWRQHVLSRKHPGSSTKTKQMRSYDACCKRMENGGTIFFLRICFPRTEWTLRGVTKIRADLFVTHDQKQFERKNSTRSRCLFAPSAFRSWR